MFEGAVCVGVATVGEELQHKQEPNICVDWSTASAAAAVAS